MMQAIYALIVLTTLLITSPVFAAKVDIEFLVDISGSMNKATGGETQIESARKALQSTLGGIPADAAVALRVYGHRVPQTDKEGSCKDTELLVPFGSLNSEQLKAKLTALTPLGYTPIAYSLEQSKADFDLNREATKTIILLTDGEETCGGDPVAVVTAMKAQGFDATVHTIGFNVDAATRAQLQGIAAAGGGQYFDAQGTSGLNSASAEATQKALYIDKEKTVYGAEIRGGDSYETAVPYPEFGKEFRLDHHQKPHFYDYFYMDLKSGQELSLETRKGEGSGESCIAIHGSERAELRAVRVTKANEREAKTIFVPKEGRYYILLGCSLYGMHNDAASFIVTSEAKGDLGTDHDAGDKRDSAMPIAPGRYEKNYIGETDRRDVFTFPAKKGEIYHIGFIPGDTGTLDVEIGVYDEYKVKLMSESVSGGMRPKTVTIAEDGIHYLVIEFGMANRGRSLQPYTLIFEKGTVQ